MHFEIWINLYFICQKWFLSRFIFTFFGRLWLKHLQFSLFYWSTKLKAWTLLISNITSAGFWHIFLYHFFFLHIFFATGRKFSFLIHSFVSHSASFFWNQNRLGEGSFSHLERKSLCLNILWNLFFLLLLLGEICWKRNHNELGL